jgi:beta-galactosidase/beta-glucuronidase
MSRSYTDIFWRKSVESSFEKSRNGNRVLAVLPDVWRFRIDPYGVGLMQDWNDINIVDSGWPTIRTLSGVWSEQGLRTYKGVAWYRTTVTLPAQHDGKVMLWFGAVDEDATVWVNGKEVGKKPDKNESNPFEFDVTSAIKPGQPNVVAVRAVNQSVDELGTGGIMKVVMFYTTAAK